MTAITHLLADPPMRALGWTLLHFLWQGALVALLLKCLLAILPTRSATLRHAAACLAMLALSLLPILTFTKLLATYTSATHFPSDFTTTEALAPFLALDASHLTPSALERTIAALNQALPAILCLWFLGVLLFLTRMNIGLLATRRLKQQSSPIASEELTTLFQALIERLGINQAVILLQSAWIEVPSVIGWLRPTILLPISCLTHLSPQQLEALLAHELAHIRRRDYLINLLQATVEALLFYHPAVWWIGNQIRIEREHCCDDIAVQACGNRLAYAQTLSLLALEQTTQPQLALGAHGGSLTMRIKRLLETKPTATPTQTRAITLAAATVIGGALLLTARAETHPNPTIPTRTSQPAATNPQSAPTTTKQEIQLALLAPPQPATQEPAREAADLHNDPYQTWVNQDVRWIINPEERVAFLALETNGERDEFITQFWERRNPTPGSPDNAFRTEHYHRIAYANEHFAIGSIPGWATDRGRIFIQHGRPDSIDAHPAGSANRSEPFEQWHYNAIQLSRLPLTLILDKAESPTPEQLAVALVQPDQVTQEQLELNPPQLDQANPQHFKVVPDKPLVGEIHIEPIKPLDSIKSLEAVKSVEFKSIGKAEFTFVDICSCGNYRLQP